MFDYRISTIFSKIGFSASLPINLYFIYLTVFHVKHVYGTYKKLIIYFAIVGILFSGLEVFTKPFAHNYINSLFYFSLNTNASSEGIRKIALVFWAGLYLVVVSSIAVQFVFRYLALLGSDYTKNLTCLENLCWLFYPLIPGLYYTATVYFLGLPDEYSDSYVKDVISENYLLPQSKLPRFIYTPYSSDGSIRWKNLSFLVSVCLLVSFHYLIILHCGFKMHLNMREELEKFSVYNRKLQLQFFKALIFQSLGPTIFIFMPAIPVLMSPMLPPTLGVHINWQTGWLFSMIGLYPPFDSIAFMVIVSEYNEILRDHFIYAFWGNSAESQIHGSLRTATAVNTRIYRIS